jgi:hypothetical protein
MAKAPAHYYERHGEINGTCDHYHRTLAGAVECLRRNQRACHALGGGAYSDAEVYEITDGVRRLVQAAEYDEDAAYDEMVYQQQMDDDREAR